MKFVLRELLLQIILLIYFISGISSTQVIEYSDKNVTTITEHSNRSFPLTISLENVTVPESTKQNTLSPKRRRRIRRKKKRPNSNQSTTVIPIFDFTTIVSTVNYPNDTLTLRTSHRRRKLKKRRKSRTRKRKENIISTTTQTISNHKLESKNLVLPIIPTEKSNPILGSSSTLTKSTPHKQTRCMKNNGGCAHICNSRKIEKCQCLKGFALSNDRHSCTDINECLINNGNCQMNCTNTIGSYRCQCPHGLRLNMDSKSCEDVNECLLRNGHGPCQDTCENTYGGYKCSCARLKGTKLGNDLHSCVDVDECAKENGGCSHICINTFGRSFCSCPEGMELAAGFKTCQDINECENENIKNQCTNGCINMEGSYRCASIVDLQNDESYSNVVCKPLFPPQNGYFKCSRKHALKTFTKMGRKRIKNSLGTKCILVCPEGFKRRGQGFRTSCGYGGQWMGNMDAKCVPNL